MIDHLDRQTAVREMRHGKPHGEAAVHVRICNTLNIRDAQPACFAFTACPPPMGVVIHMSSKRTPLAFISYSVVMEDPRKSKQTI